MISFDSVGNRPLIFVLVSPKPIPNLYPRQPQSVIRVGDTLFRVVPTALEILYLSLQLQV